MKIYHSLFKLIILANLLMLPLSLFAKEINLYELPKTDSKVVEKVDLANGIMPIYTPKEGEWIKVADPANGNVGWVKSSDLNQPGSAITTFSFSQGNGKNNPVNYRVIQFGQPQNLTPEQSQAMIKRIQLQQEMFQKSFQNMMQDFNQLFQDQMPIIVFPSQQNVMTTQPVQKNNGSTKAVAPTKSAH